MSRRDEWLVQLPGSSHQLIAGELSITAMTTKALHQRGYFCEILSFDNMQAHSMGQGLAERAESGFAEMTLTVGKEIQGPNTGGHQGDVVH